MPGNIVTVDIDIDDIFDNIDDDILVNKFLSAFPRILEKIIESEEDSREFLEEVSKYYLIVKDVDEIVFSDIIKKFDLNKIADKIIDRYISENNLRMLIIKIINILLYEKKILDRII